MSQKRQAILLADLGFGDAGKGTITDYLTRQLVAHTVVRYNGGPQAAHNVITPAGRHHTFAQFGSGTFLPRTKTLLSRFMLVNPLNMLKEERHLRTIGVTDALQRLLIDRRALVITPFQQAINRLREVARAGARHGSCGEGVGECMADHLTHGDAVLFAGDLQNRTKLIKKLSFLCAVKQAELGILGPQLPDTELVRQEQAIFAMPDAITDCADVYQHLSSCVTIVDEADIYTLFAQTGTMLFEGAQGVLLDEYYGFAPYTTWNTTTFANAETLLREHDYTGNVIKLGVLRAYATRHGAGPFPTEDPDLTRVLPDQQNIWNTWQQTFRVGHFDLVATRYARDVVGKLDYLAITNIDRLATLSDWQICNAYRYQGAQNDLSSYFEQAADGRLTHIKVSRPADLTHQEKLTQRLLLCMPAYQPARAEQADYLSLLEKNLSIPIGIASYGPCAVHKRSSEAFMRVVSAQ